MRLIRTAATVAGAAAALLVATAPAALADSPTVDVTPSPTAPGTATTFAIFCGSLMAGGPAASATLFGTTLGLPARIPMQASTHSDEFVTTVNLPASILPGTYHPSIDCSNGVTATVAVRVSAVPGQGAATGDGTTSTATSGWLTVVGLCVLGLGAVTGGLAVRRRLRPGGRG